MIDFFSFPFGNSIPIKKGNIKRFSVFPFLFQSLSLFLNLFHSFCLFPHEIGWKSLYGWIYFVQGNTWFSLYLSSVEAVFSSYRQLHIKCLIYLCHPIGEWKDFSLCFRFQSIYQIVFLKLSTIDMFSILFGQNRFSSITPNDTNAIHCIVTGKLFHWVQNAHMITWHDEMQI